MEESTLSLPDDPLRAFDEWLSEAVRQQCPEPTAMTLATTTKGGMPSARIVLFKGLSDGAFSFYTNFESRKGQELNDNPHAALLFFWHQLKRQIRIEGRVEPVPAVEADEYFASRPRGSQIGAWSSPQSRVIDSRDDLLERVQGAAARFANKDVPRPSYWGGYRVRPRRIEFWEDRPSRLHERFVFERVGDAWVKSRLAP